MSQGLQKVLQSPKKQSPSVRKNNTLLKIADFKIEKNERPTYNI